MDRSKAGPCPASACSRFSCAEGEQVIAMVPFCRTPDEADRALAAMAENGCVRGEHGIDSIALDSDSFVSTTRHVATIERRLAARASRPAQSDEG
jgi:hypothetical protein